MTNPTLESIQIAMANLRRLRNTQLLDFGPWRRAHPELMGLRMMSDVAYDSAYEFAHDQSHDDADPQLRPVHHDEPQHEFSQRFRER